MEGLLYLPMWSNVLIEIQRAPEHRRYCQSINREVKASLNHLRAIVKLLEEANLIEIIPKNKIKTINITEKGKKVVKNILDIKTELRLKYINESFSQ